MTKKMSENRTSFLSHFVRIFYVLSIKTVILSVFQIMFNYVLNFTKFGDIMSSIDRK